MKELLVLTSTYPRWKGDTVSPFVYDLSQRLTENYSVTVLAPHFAGAKSYEVMEGQNVYRFRYGPKTFEKLAGGGGILPTIKQNKWLLLSVPLFIISEIFATLHLVKKIRPSVIHAHWVIPQGIAAYINYLINKTPYVITSHGSDLHSLGFNRLKKVILQNASSITVVSKYLQEKIGQIDPSLLAKTTIIPMGVDTKKFSPQKFDNSIKKKYGINGIFLLFTGRLAPEKGVINLIEAMPLVVDKHKDAKLLIIGDGPLRNNLEDTVKNLNLQNNVIFTGPMKHSDLPAYFATTDIFISPSLREGTPATYLEALASGTYIIAGDIPVSRELIKSVNVGALVSSDSKEIAATILRSITILPTNKKSNIDLQYSEDEIKEKFCKVLDI